MREKKKQYLLSSRLSESSSSDEEDKIGADRSKYILTEAIEAKIRNQPKSSKTGEHPITTPSKKEKKGKTNKKIAIEDVARRSDAVGEEDINQLLNSSSETEIDTRTQTKRSKKKQVRNKYFSKFYICKFFLIFSNRRLSKSYTSASSLKEKTKKMCWESNIISDPD